jgi:hypothetical protein
MGFRLCQFRRYVRQWQSRTKQTRSNLQELIVSSLAMADALAKLLIEKGIITQNEFMRKLSEERAAYQKLFNPTQQ